MMQWTAEQREKLRGLLLEEQEDVRRHLELAEEAERESLSEAVGEISSYDNHPADLATETADRERDMAIDASFRERLDEVDEALRRMKDGSYGICEACGRMIEYERLEAIPWARTCIHDSQAAEAGAADIAAAGADRPVEEQVMTPPPTGRSGPQGHFDDADAWKQAESYGSSDSMAGR